LEKKTHKKWCNKPNRRLSKLQLNFKNVRVTKNVGENNDIHSYESDIEQMVRKLESLIKEGRNTQLDENCIGIKFTLVLLLFDPGLKLSVLHIISTFTSKNEEYNTKLIGSSRILSPYLMIIPSSKEFIRHLFLDGDALTPLI
jgi:hypothetical protein